VPPLEPRTSMATGRPWPSTRGNRPYPYPQQHTVPTWHVKQLIVKNHTYASRRTHLHKSRHHTLPHYISFSYTLPHKKTWPAAFINRFKNGRKKDARVRAPAHHCARLCSLTPMHIFCRVLAECVQEVRSERPGLPREPITRFLVLYMRA